MPIFNILSNTYTKLSLSLPYYLSLFLTITLSISLYHSLCISLSSLLSLSITLSISLYHSLYISLSALSMYIFFSHDICLSLFLVQHTYYIQFKVAYWISSNIAIAILNFSLLHPIQLSLCQLLRQQQLSLFYALKGVSEE